jgi:hypothetical protein
MVATLNTQYDRALDCLLVPMPKFALSPPDLHIPTIARRHGWNMKASKERVEKAKAARAVNREMKM